MSKFLIPQLLLVTSNCHEVKSAPDIGTASGMRRSFATTDIIFNDRLNDDGGGAPGKEINSGGVEWVIGFAYQLLVLIGRYLRALFLTLY
jgi:hypothetical protein